MESENESWWRDAYAGIPTPKTISKRRKDAVPSTLMVAKYIQNVESRRLLHVLFNPGGSHTLIHSRALPRGATPGTIEGGQRSLQTIAGTFASNRVVRLDQLTLPEFDKQKEVDRVHAFVFDSPCNYDIILGRDFLSSAGIQMDFQTGTMKWLERTIEMKPPGYWQVPAHIAMAFWDETFEEFDDAEDEKKFFEAMSAEIKEAKYEQVTAKQVVDAQDHLTVEEKLKLEKLLDKYPVLFDGTLGHFKGRKIHLELTSGAMPFHSKAYSVPKSHELVFLKELQHLVDIG
ncbi:MAG: retropepsin-like aspartic protease, partial [Marinobacter sp.]